MIEAEQRTRAAETARERLREARIARARQQLEPLRQRQHELAAQLAVIGAKMQAGIAASLAEARAIFREAQPMYEERRRVANAML